MSQRNRSVRIVARFSWPARSLGLFALALALTAPAGADPRPGDSFRAVEQQVTSLQAKLVETTVDLRIDGVSGSGVLISPDGYVLTAGHVTGKPNLKCLATMADGQQH